MIGYIQGKVIHSDEGVVLLENNGIGYEIVCSGALYAKLLTDGQGEAYTYLQVRDDGVSLYGFCSPAEKNMFLKLVSVSGVGPKLGMAVLSGMDINALAVAIASSDIKRLSAVKGLGKKTAERIVLELREKVTQEASSGSAPSGAAPLLSFAADDEDALVALMSLGFTRAESTKAIGRAHAQGAVAIEDVIRAALKSM